MSEWQAIETAPKDGTVIDLGCVNSMDDDPGHSDYRYGFVRFPACRWLVEYTQVPRWVDRSNEETVEDNGWRATHWMPIAAPPAQAIEAQRAETTKIGSVEDESAVRKDAPAQSQPSSGSST